MTFRVDIATEQRRAQTRVLIDGRDSIYTVTPDEARECWHDRFGQYLGCDGCQREIGDYHKLGCQVGTQQIKSTGTDVQLAGPAGNLKQAFSGLAVAFADPALRRAQEQAGKAFEEMKRENARLVAILQGKP